MTSPSESGNTNSQSTVNTSNESSGGSGDTLPPSNNNDNKNQDNEKNNAKLKNNAEHIFGEKKLEKHKLSEVLQQYNGDMEKATFDITNTAKKSNYGWKLSEWYSHF